VNNFFDLMNAVDEPSESLLGRGVSGARFLAGVVFRRAG